MKPIEIKYCENQICVKEQVDYDCLSKWNINNIHCIDCTNPDAIAIRLIFYDLTTFQNSNRKQLFGQDFYTKDNKDNFIPTIHISLFDFLEDNNTKLFPYIPRYKNIIDSSIWNYYVPYYKKDKKDKKDFSTRLEGVITEITNNKELGLYDCMNAKEIIEFKSRILQQSYVDPLGGHGNLVAPFLFHSETQMKKWAVETNKNNKDEKSELKLLKENSKLEGRILLIDDHATVEKTNEALNGKDPNSIVPKCKIIRNILSPYFTIKCTLCNKCMNPEIDGEHENCCRSCSNGGVEDSKKLIIYFDCATTFEDAKKKIGKTKYDIILLDYLLDDTGINGRHCAYELLKDLKENLYDVNKKNGIILPEKFEEWGIEEDWRENQKKFLEHWRAPNGKFNFFFISAFTNAVNERMLAEGLDFYSDIWHISRGACPTTTPHLFLYYLLRFMNSQIYHLKTDDEFLTLYNLISKIYCDKNSMPRDKAIKYFNSLLHMRLKYDKLKYDACFDYTGKRTKNKNLNSPLVQSLFPDLEFYDNAFWEHLTHLVYLTAYGTIRQWSDMWEEYMLIKETIKNAEEKINPNIKIEQRITTKIENYIIRLQTGQ